MFLNYRLDKTWHVLIYRFKILFQDLSIYVIHDEVIHGNITIVKQFFFNFNIIYFYTYLQFCISQDEINYIYISFTNEKYRT